MLPVYHHLCVGYSPENLFFLEDQVNQGDQEDPKSEIEWEGETEGNVAERGREIESERGKEKKDRVC